MHKYVLVHGAYHGGWCWRKISDIFRAQMVEAFYPTLTGLGDRIHLLTSDVGLSTHISDIVELIRFENLHDIILVGHSYAGMVISGVAEVIADRISHLVYLDALVPLNGQTVFDILPGTLSRAEEITISDQKVRVISSPGPRAFGVEDPVDIRWMAPRLTPMPYNCYAEQIKINESAGINIPRTYFLCSRQLGGELQCSHENAFERARKEGWRYKILSGSHDIMVTNPVELAEHLLDIPLI